MKKILVVLLAALLVSPVFANLVDEVDKLTPEQAEQFQKKLDQKKFEGLPANTRISGGLQTVNADAFNAAFPGLPPLHSVLVGSFDVRQPLTDKLLIGGSFSGAGNYLFHESATKVYEDLFLVVGSAQLVLEYRLVQTGNFIMSLTPGAGFMIGGYNYTKTNDNTQTYYNTNRWGSGTCTSLALDLNWKLANEWGLGFGVSAFSGKLGGMRKIFSDVDATAPEIDLTGTAFKIIGSKAF